VSIPVSDFGRASRVTFSIDGTECNRTPTSTTVGINHSFVGDLVGQLTAPSGATALVFSRNGGTGENMCQVVFDDDATTPFSTVTSANAPFTGTWAPVNPISPLRGGPADGTWTFKVTDTAGADTGSLRSVSLHLNGYISE
jgi:subtilisin-like proprotein convertase family protein